MSPAATKTPLIPMHIVRERLHCLRPCRTILDELSSADIQSGVFLVATPLEGGFAVLQAETEMVLGETLGDLSYHGLSGDDCLTFTEGLAQAIEDPAIHTMITNIGGPYRLPHGIQKDLLARCVERITDRQPLDFLGLIGTKGPVHNVCVSAPSTIEMGRLVGRLLVTQMGTEPTRVVLRGYRQRLRSCVHQTP